MILGLFVPLAIVLATCIPIQAAPPSEDVRGPVVYSGTGPSHASLHRQHEISKRVRQLENQIDTLKKQLER